MKKKYIGAILLSLCVAISFMFGITAFAAGKSFDGTTNLATDASKWTESSWTVANNYATIDENGITFTEYGTASAVAAVSLKEGLPYSGRITINFCSQIPDSGNPAGFMKVIFADGSGSANGSAMKPWEISDKAEHLALEINFSGISLWRYNIGNTEYEIIKISRWNTAYFSSLCPQESQRLLLPPLLRASPTSFLHLCSIKDGTDLPFHFPVLSSFHLSCSLLSPASSSI